jgi:tetratricopeptide (TPR) repeat protein
MALLSLIFIGGATIFSQDKPDPNKRIDLDQALRSEEPQDRAKSYFHYSLAKFYEDSGDTTRAVKEMRSALSFNRNSSEVRVELAALLEKTGSVQEAIREAQEASRMDPKNPEPHWLLANIYFKSMSRDRSGSREALLNAIRELEAMREAAPSDPRAYFALGKAYFEIQEPEKAIAAYEKLEEIAPGTSDGYVEIAKYYEQNGKPEQAVQYLERAVKRHPDSPQTLVALAGMYSNLKKHKEAIPLYRKVLDQHGDNPAVKKKLAESMIEAGEGIEEALELLQDVTKNTPRDREAKILLGRAYLGANKHKDAIGVFKALLEEEPDQLDAEFYLAAAYQEGGQPSEAAAIYVRLLEKGNDGSEQYKVNRPVFQQRLAAVYQDMGEHEKAIAIYEDMLKNQPDARPGVLFMLINAYRINRQFDKAIALGQEHYQKNPKDTGVALVYARSLADGGRTREGIDILQKMLREDPSNVDVYVNLSQIYLQGKKYDDAERVLRRAEDRRLDSERVKFQLATVYERQKDFEKAETLFKEILKENPKNATALNYIGYMLADRGVRLQEAVQYVEEALALDPDNGAYLDSLGWAFFKLNDLEKAEKYLLRAVEIVRDDPVIHDHLGDLYHKTGDYQRALDYWKKSLDNGTESEDNAKVRDKLEKLQEKLKKERGRNP